MIIVNIMFIVYFAFKDLHKGGEVLAIEVFDITLPKHLATAAKY